MSEESFPENNEAQSLIRLDSSSRTYGSVNNADDAAASAASLQYRRNNTHQIATTDNCPCDNHPEGLVTRFLWQDPHLSKILLYPFLENFPGKDRSERFAARARYFLRANTVPQKDKNRIRAALMVTGFLQGARLITETLWPLAFIGLLAHDIAMFYLAPNMRFGNTLGKILAGTSRNQMTWSTYLGSNLPGNWRYFLVPGAIAGTAFLSGIVNVLRRYGWSESLSSNNFTEENSKIENEGHESENANDIEMPEHPVSPVKRAISTNDQLIKRLESFSPQREQSFNEETTFLLPAAAASADYDAASEYVEDENSSEEHEQSNEPEISVLATALVQRMNVVCDPSGHYLSHATFAVLWDKRLNEEERMALVRAIESQAMEGNIVRQWRARSALAQIADSFDSQTMRLFPVASLQQAGSVSLKTLTDLAVFSGTPAHLLRYVHAQYLLWKIGQRSNIFLRPMFWAFSLYLLYAKASLWEMWVTRIMGGIHYLLERSACEQSGRIWRYLEQFGDYFCTNCGDWPFVYVGDVSSAEGCWNGLFAAPRSYRQITEGVHRLIDDQGFHPKTLDLSQQPWTSWTTAEWQHFLDDMAQRIHVLPALNLSQPVENPFYVDNGRMADLGEFLHKVSVGGLDLENQGMGPTAIQPVFSALSNSSVSYLGVSGNQLGDIGMQALAENFPPELTTLHVANNQASDCGVAELASALRNNTALTEANFSENLFSQAGIDAIAEVLPTTKIETLDLSGNDFSGTDLTPLWQASASGSALETVDLSDCGLSDTHLMAAAPYFGKASIRTIKASNNEITDTGAVEFFDGIGSSNSSISGVNLDSNLLTDTTLIDSPWTETNLQSVSMARNSFSPAGITVFARALPASKITSVGLSGNFMGDAGAIAISQAMNATGSPLENVDLSYNNIGEKGGVAVVKSAKHCDQLNLGNNALGDKTAHAIAKILPDSDITELRIQGNEISATGAREIAKALPHANNLEVLDISHNPIGPAGNAALAKQFIGPVEDVPFSDLAQKELSEDQARALHEARASEVTVRSLNVADTELNTESARIYCRVWPQTDRSMTDLQLAPNAVSPDEIDLNNCEMSAASSTRDSFVFRLFSPLRHWSLWQRRPAATTDNAFTETDTDSDAQSEISDMSDLSDISEFENNLNFIDSSDEFIQLPAAGNNLAACPTPQYALSANSPLALPSNTPGNTSNNLPATSTMAFAMASGVVPLIMGLIVLYLLYRLLKPGSSYVLQKTGLFAPRISSSTCADFSFDQSPPEQRLKAGLQ